MAKTEKMMSPFSAFEAFTSGPSDSLKKGMEQAMSAAGDFGNLSRDGLAAVSESAKASAKGMKEMNEQAMSYAQEAYSAGMEATRSISSAQSVSEAVELQTAYAKSAMDAYVEQMSSFMNLAAGTMRESIEPLNAHASQMVEKMQSAS